MRTIHLALPLLVLIVLMGCSDDPVTETPEPTYKEDWSITALAEGHTFSIFAKTEDSKAMLFFRGTEDTDRELVFSPHEGEAQPLRRGTPQSFRTMRAWWALSVGPLVAHTFTDEGRRPSLHVWRMGGPDVGDIIGTEVSEVRLEGSGRWLSFVDDVDPETSRGSLKAYDLENEAFHELAGEASISEVVGSRDGSRLIFRDADGLLSFWEAGDDGSVVVAEEVGEGRFIVIDDAKAVIYAGEDGLHLWETSDGSSTSFEAGVDIPPGGVSPGQDRLALRRGGSLDVWNRTTRERVEVHENPSLGPVAFSRDGNMLSFLANFEEGVAELVVKPLNSTVQFNIAEGVSSVQLVFQDSAPVLLAILGHGEAETTTYRLWHPVLIEAVDLGEDILPTSLWTTADAMRWIGIEKDGDVLYHLDLETRERTRIDAGASLPFLRGCPQPMSTSGDRVLYFKGDDGEGDLHIWEAESGQRRRILTDITYDAERCQGIWFDAELNHVVARSQDDSLLVWGGEAVHRLTDRAWPPVFALSSDGKTLAWAVHENAIPRPLQIWNLQTGARHELPDDVYPLTALLTPDGARLVYRTFQGSPNDGGECGGFYCYRPLFVVDLEADGPGEPTRIHRNTWGLLELIP
ncbi:MAG: hypothetical protein ACNA8W_17285, partial [Bradymonadaceae bacterium]